MLRKGKPNIRKEQNSKVNRGVNLTQTNHKEYVSVMENETREYLKLLELEKAVDQELAGLIIQEKEFCSTEETMDLLHKYNDIKDATQTIIGAIAVSNETTVRSLYQRYGLSTEED